MQKLIWQNSKGEEINLTSGHYGITNWQGFSEVSSNVQSQTVPFQDGSVYLDALLGERELSVTLAIQDNNDLELRYQLRRELIHALNPKLGEGYLIYTNDFISKRIKCVANVPVFENHNSNDTGTPKASLTWTACEPYWEDLEETVVQLNYREIVTIENNGDVPVQIEFEIKDICENPMIQNLTTDKKIQFNGEARGLKINTHLGEKSVMSADTDTISYELTSGGDFEDIATDGNKKIYVGNQIAIEKNGMLMVIKVNEVIKSFYRSVAYGNNVFVAVGEQTIVSSDGVTWERVSIQTNNFFRKVKFYNGVFIAVGENGRIATSTNGYDWIEQTSGVNTRLLDIVYGNNVYIVIEDGTKRILKSADLKNWEEITINLNDNISRIVFFNDKFVLIANRKVYTSTNGISWGSNVATLTYGCTGLIVFKNTIFVLCINNEYYYRVYKSSDSINWNLLNNWTFPTILTAYINNICSLEKLTFIGSSGLIAESDDGVNLITKRIAMDSNFGKPAIINNKVYISNTMLMISVDGENWQVLKDSLQNNLQNAFANNIYINAGKEIYKSTDGENYTFINDVSEIFTNWSDISYLVSNGNIFVAILGWDIFTSSDGENWTLRFSQPNSAYFSGCVFNGTYFIAITNDGKVYKSTNGQSWNLLIDMQMGTYALFWVNNQFFAIFSQILYSSTDATSWTEVESFPEDMIPTGIAYGNGIYFTVGYDRIFNTRNLMYISSNLTKWTKYEVSVIGSINWVIFKDNYFLIFAESGIVLKTRYLATRNAIDKISSDSDMNLNLATGNNKVYYANNGIQNIKGTLKFRQKYIGV